MSTKEQGLMDVGVHCFACGKLDFLPFKCAECSQSFCGEHRKTHNCAFVVNDKKTSAIKPINKPVSQLGVKLGGGAKEESVRPPPTARNELTRKCLEKTKTQSVGSIAAFAKLRASFPSLEKSKLRFSGAAILNPMLEIKKNAKGDNKIPMQNRVYFYLNWPGSKTREKITRPVFYNKTLVVGKLLDMACESLDLSVKDKFCEGNKVNLYIEGQMLQAGKKLGDLKEFQGKNPVTVTIRA